MDIHFGCFHRKFNVTDSAHSQNLYGYISMVYAAKFPDADISDQLFCIFLDEGWQIYTANLFFTLKLFFTGNYS